MLPSPLKPQFSRAPQGHVETSAADATRLGAPGEANFSWFLGLKPGPSLVVHLIEEGILLAEQNGDSVKGRESSAVGLKCLLEDRNFIFDPEVLEGKGKTTSRTYRTKF